MRISKSNKKVVKATTNTKPDLKNMTDDQLKELLTDVIDEREGFAEDDMSERATYLDDLYQDIDNELASRKEVKGCNATTDTDKALKHIRAAIDILGKSGKKDEITKDSIANLGVVMFDLKGRE